MSGNPFLATAAWRRTRFGKRFSLYLAALISLVALVLLHFGVFHSHAHPMNLQLARGEFTVLDFPARKAGPVAIVLFASGDGGWSMMEERICHALQKNDYEVVGIDSYAYAKTDYDLRTVQADFEKIAQRAKGACGLHTLPLIVGGYSMGAATAIAVAGGPNPPHGLAGLLLLDPLSRGRYGLRAKDRMNVLPAGPGTFAVADFAQSLTKLRVVQWHAENDDIDSRSWLEKLPAEHREYDFPGTGHDYRHNREEFIRQLVGSVEWLLNAGTNGKITTGDPQS